MSVSDIEAAYKAHAAELGECGTTLKFDFGDDQLFIDGTVTPATIAHSNEEADCVVKVTAENLTKIVSGEINVYEAFRDGKIRIRGSAAIALKFHSIASKARGKNS